MLAASYVRSCPMIQRIFLPISLLILLALPSPLLAGPDEGVVPAALKDWVPWVLRDHPELACPRFAGARLCAWPGRLELQVDRRGGRFALDVLADRELDLPLPGSTEYWPGEVRVDGKVALMRRSGSVPTVHLAQGSHRITGTFQWTRIPAQLPVASAIGLIDLQVEGRHIVYPVRESDGSLSLETDRAAEGSEQQEDVLAIEVHRRIDDGVPVQMTARLKLRVSGQAREEDLGLPLTVGFEPVEVTSNLPARLDDDSRLRVQLRPGTWQVTLRSRSTGPVTAISPGATEAPWPEEEVWVFSAATAVRAVQLGGVPGVDPQRTSLDPDWRGLPAFRVGRGESLEISELRRGEAEPPPDSLQVDRTLWLEGRDGGLVVRDSVAGEFHRGGRLHLLAPGELGHVKLAGLGRVITQSESGAPQGVEIRSGRINMTAESSYAGGGALPAVGWDRDATSLSATLNLPPGWKLLATSGVDGASSTWIELWSLLDLFFLLLICLALFKTLDIRWGILGLLLLGISWHEPEAPRLGWLALLGLSALLTVSLRPWLEKLLRLARLAVIVVLSIQVAIFAWAQISTGLFPQLEHHGMGPMSDYGYQQSSTPFSLGATSPAPEEAEMMGSVGGLELPQASASLDSIEMEKQVAETARLSLRSAGSQRVQVGGAKSKSSTFKKRRSRAGQVDMLALVQTGLGVPKWSWNRHHLEWSGPVASGHEFRLFLLPPWAAGLASLLRVLGMILLLVCLGAPRRDPPASKAEPPGPAQPGVAAALLLGALLLSATALLMPASAQAQSTPQQETLDELKTHLLQLPDCGKQCVEVAAIHLDAGPRGLRVEAELHVLAPSAWLLPGPGTAWVPSEVSVDGKQVSALRRRADGFFALRVEAGHHRVVLEGSARDEVSLQFPLVPRRLSWSGQNWSIDGYRADAPPPRSVTLRQAEGLESVDPDSKQDAPGSADLPAWLELHRELDIGVPWLVHNTLRRLSPATRAVHARVPLLEGESVTSSGIVVDAGEAQVTLEPGESSRSWESTLEEVDTLVLTAPLDRPWLERWALDCSPIWSCTAEGLVPTRHMSAGRASPSWLPWAGESVRLTFVKPPPAKGATTTVDEATLTIKPGRRVLAADVAFGIRSSQGGEQSIKIPAGAEVQSFHIDGQQTPFDAKEGEVAYILEPGEHQVRVSWRQDQQQGLCAQTPAVALSSGAANVLVRMELPDNKWLLWAQGPSWGGVVMLWQYVLVLVLLAWLLGRYAPTVLKGRHWFILGLGMTQVPIAAPIVVVVWLVALGMRGRSGEYPWMTHNLFQLALLGLTPIALAMVYWAVHSGLLMQPDMQVAGAGSSGGILQWFEQRTDGAFAQPWVLWLPLWVWRVVMLLWALWLAVHLFQWGLWGWKQVSVGGLWKMPDKSKAEPLPSTVPVPASEPMPPPEEG